MNLIAAHKAGNHDEELKSGCRVCDAFLAYFVRYGATLPKELEAKEIAEAEFDEEPGEDWEEDEDGFVTVPLSNSGDLNREGDPAFNGAFNRW